MTSVAHDFIVALTLTLRKGTGRKGFGEALRTLLPDGFIASSPASCLSEAKSPGFEGGWFWDGGLYGGVAGGFHDGGLYEGAVAG